MTSDREASFLANINPNLGIVHRLCHVYFPYEPLEREDLFQEIMYQLWKAFPHFKHDSKFSTWMYAVALNTAITHVRRNARSSAAVELDETLPATPYFNDHMAHRENASLLYAAIATLKNIDKAIVFLHFEGYTYDEIASITGLTATNVSVRLVRLKKALKDIILQNES